MEHSGSSVVCTLLISEQLSEGYGVPCVLAIGVGEGGRGACSMQMVISCSRRRCDDDWLPRLRRGGEAVLNESCVMPERNVVA